MIKKQKFAILLVPVLLLSAGCGPFSHSTTTGVVKTTNGGLDWQFINKVPDVKNGTLATLNMSELQVDPREPDHIFAGSYTGGLFKSEDAGNNWKIILSRIAVYDFALDPQDKEVMFAAGFFGDHGKVLVTKDGGKSWTETFNEEDLQNPVRGIAINPQNSQEVVLGMTSGSVIGSTDGGVHWKLLVNLSDRINRVRWQNGAMYILAEEKGLYKSTDGGVTFQNLTASLAANQSLAGVEISGPSVGSFNRMAVDTNNPSLIYLTTTAGLYKTLDEGRNWMHLNLPLKMTAVPTRAVAISPLSNNMVYTTAGATIYKTVDGGTTWQTQAVSTDGFVNTIVAAPQLPQVAYAGIFSED